MNSAKKGVLTAAVLITVLTLFSRVAGLLRKLAQSWAMSDGAVATAYDTANTVPNVLFEIAAGGALAGAVIPLISGFLAKDMRKEASQTASALITWVVMLGVPVALIVAAAATPISHVLFGSGTDPQIVALAASILRICAFQIPLYGLSVVFTGILQAHHKFILPALSPLLSSLVVIVVFVGYGAVHGPSAEPHELSLGSVVWLAMGTTAGVIVFSLPQLIPAMRVLTLRPTVKFPNGVGRRTLRLAGAGLGALSAQQLAIIAVMVVANMSGGIGTYTTFNYAWALFMVPYAVLAVPIATSTFPHIAAAVVQSDSSVLNERVHVLIARSTRLVLAMGIAAGAMLIVLAKPAQIVVQMGSPIEGLDIALIAMGVGVAAYSVMYHGARVLYALERGTWVILANSVGWGIVIVGLFVGAMFVQGRIPTLILVGVSMSVGLVCGAITLLLAIAKIAGKPAVHGCVRTASVVALCEIIAAVPAWFAVQGIVNAMEGSFIAAVIAAFAGAVILVAGLAAALWCADRDALQSLR